MLLSEELKQVSHRIWFDEGLKALGHHRLVGHDEFIDVFPKQRLTFSFGVHQVDRGPRLSGQHSRNQQPIQRHDLVGTEVGFDVAVGVQDVRQKLFLRVHRHPGQVGADLRSQVPILMAFGTLILEDLFTASHVAVFLQDSGVLGDYLLAIGIGHRSTLCQ